MAILKIRPRRSRSRLRSKSRSDIFRDCLSLLPCKIWRPYLENWPSYDYLKNSTFEVEVKAEVKIEVRYIYGLSKSTTMQNLEVLSRKLTELWLFKKFDLRGRGRGWGQNRKILSKFVRTIHTNFYAKSGLCNSRNERVMLFCPNVAPSVRESVSQWRT